MPAFKQYPSLKHSRQTEVEIPVQGPIAIFDDWFTLARKQTRNPEQLTAVSVVSDKLARVLQMTVPTATTILATKSISTKHAVVGTAFKLIFIGFGRVLFSKTKIVLFLVDFIKQKIVPDRRILIYKRARFSTCYWKKVCVYAHSVTSKIKKIWKTNTLLTTIRI